jgi:3-oxoacid CoA-transferase subunit A
MTIRRPLSVLLPLLLGPLLAPAAAAQWLGPAPRVDPGQIEPDQVHTPGIYVARILKSGKLEKPIEQRTVRKRVA